MTESVPDPFKTSNADHNFIRRIRLIEGEIARQSDVAAIAMAVDMTLDTGQGTNPGIIAAAGPVFDEAILEHIYRPRVGDVYVLPGYDLPVAHVLVAVTPEWRGGVVEDRDLVRCYRGLMDMAWRMGIETLAVSVVGTGKHQFALSRAVRLMLQGVRERMPEDLKELRIVCESKAVYDAVAERLASMQGDV